ncbi:MAG: hypothetical protein WC209_16760 [Ignavibacteriaceae bacterium]|jgi:hypothetical protein
MSDKNPSVNVPRDIILQAGDTFYKVAQGKPGLLKYGINETYLAEFQADITKARSFKNDLAATNEKKEGTKTKNLKLDAAYKWLKDAKYHFFNKFQKTDPPFVEFPSNISIYSKNESKMVDLLPNIIKLLTKYKTDLTAMPEELIAEGEVCLAELNEKNTKQEVKKKDSKNYTATRRAAELIVLKKVNKIVEAGQLAYAEQPEMLKYFESPWPRSKGGKGEEPPPAS